MCHQNGLEVDIRYVRNDGLEGLSNIAETPWLIDEDKSIALIKHLISYGNVYLIYVDTLNSDLNQEFLSIVV